MELIISYLITVLGVMCILKILKLPLKWIITIGINTILGGIVIILINIFGSTIGIGITLRWYTAVIVGTFGLPGVIIAYLLQIFM